MRKFWVSIVAIMMLLFASACGQADNNDASNNANSSENDAENVENEDENSEDEAESDDENLETEYPLTIVDVTGTEITIEKEPERIVSTSTSDTEVLFALGLADQIVGVSDFDNYPEEALDKPKMGGVVEPNFEAMIAEEPDIVFTGNSISEEATERIRELDLILYKTDPKNMEETLELILETGVITNRQKEAQEVVAEMEKVIEEVQETVADIDDADREKVYIEYNPGWTVGAGEFMNELIEMAGGVNIAADEEGWIQVNEEKVIQDDPYVIFYAADLVDHDTGEKLSDLIKDRSGWDEITAIKEDRMVPIQEDIMSRNGPRIVDALMQIAVGIYPDLFEQ